MGVCFKPHCFSCHYADLTALAVLGGSVGWCWVYQLPKHSSATVSHFSPGHHSPALNSQNTVLMTVFSHGISFAIEERPIRPQATQKDIAQMAMKESQNKYECLGTEPTHEFKTTVCLT